MYSHYSLVLFSSVEIIQMYRLFIL